MNEAAGIRVWLERGEGAAAIDAMILERWAAGVRQSLGHAGSESRIDLDVRLAIDEYADPEQRAGAAQRLGVTGATCVVAGLPIGNSAAQTFPARLRTRVGHLTAAILPAISVTDVAAVSDTALPPDWRIGIGSTVPSTELQRSWSEALTALRLTADGSPGEAGDLRVAYADLGGLAVLAEAVSAESANIPDVQAISAVFDAHSWALLTLDALNRQGSLRQAAQELHVHHSTLQERVIILRRELGFAADTPNGRTRTALALTLRRLHRSGDLL